MALTPRPFGTPTRPPLVSGDGPLRRCTFRHITTVRGLTDDVSGYEVACMFPDRLRAVPLGDIERARAICEACTAKGIFRADSD